MEEQKVYVVTAHRWGENETHNYVVGVTADPDEAEEWAYKEHCDRGGKYECSITMNPLGVPAWEFYRDPPWMSDEVTQRIIRKCTLEQAQNRALLMAQDLLSFMRASIGADGAPIELCSGHEHGDIYCVTLAEKLTALENKLAEAGYPVREPAQQTA